MSNFRRLPEDDQFGPPPPLFRIGQRPRFGDFGPWVRWAVVAFVALVAFILADVARSIYTNVLWFDSLDYNSVYTKRLLTQLVLFVAGFLLFLALLWPNVWLARRGVAHFVPRSDEPDPIARIVRVSLLVGAVLVAVIFGLVASDHWDEVLLWREKSSFGVEDAQFGRDVSFYMFTLPVLHLVHDWLMGALIMTLLPTAAIYAVGVRRLRSGLAVPPAAKVHLSVLATAVLLVFAYGHWLGQFDFLFRSAGAVHGVGYTDANARIPLQYVLIAFAAIAAAATVAGIWLRGVAIPAVAIGVWLIAGVIVANVYPAAVQRLQVEPNEIAKERRYLARNIEATRAAFGLDRIEEQMYRAEPTVSRAVLDQNPDTIRDIRLWDPRPLRDTYSQIQGLRPLYDFADVDVDRYDFGTGGSRRQVMLSARELSHSRLPADARGWINRHLQFTHGYGVVMSPVNEVTASGLPSLFVQDIPVRLSGPAAQSNLKIDRPEIYFGELTQEYAIVNTKEQEFDRPEGDTNVYSTYQGDSGVRIGSMLRRLAYAWQFADANILISGAISGDSRILYRRDIRERVGTLAPFLELDPDPYLVAADGRLFWIVDAYTTTTRYPYSKPHPVGYNYIRNSVKATVDAYSGDVRFYIVDDTDPIIRTWAKVFPKLFLAVDRMPPSLRDHIRYPEGLFRAQAEMYRTYHMRDPQVFYNREDLWTIPRETFGDSEVPVDPYYVTLRLPGFERPEFVLILPFSPANRDNAVSLLAARSDGANYGKMLALRFPTGDLIPGPRQIEARIDQDSLVAEQLTLWNQAGSQVIRGNLLMVPVGTSYLYIEPLYLRASTLSIPEIRRVIVVANNVIAMEPTLEAALAVVFGERAPTRPEGATGSGAGTPTPTATATPPRPSPTEPPPAIGTPGALSDDVPALARLAQEAYDRAQERLRAGDLAGYERELRDMERSLRRMVELTRR